PSMRLSSASMRLQHSAQLGLATGMSSSRHVLYTKDDTEELGEDNGIPLSNLQSDDCPLTDDSDVEEVTVTREPNQKSLGFSVISEVGEAEGRPCHRRQLRVGDRLLAVNDLQVAGLSPEELFSRLCPCKSAGLAFKQGDIIRVLNKSDRQLVAGPRPASGWVHGPSWHFPARPKFQRKHLVPTSRLRRPRQAWAAGFCFISKKEFKRFRKAGEFVEQLESRGTAAAASTSTSVKRGDGQRPSLRAAARPTAWRALRSRRPASHALHSLRAAPQHPQQLRDILGQLEKLRKNSHSTWHLCDLFLQLTDLSSAVQQLVEQLEKLEHSASKELQHCQPLDQDSPRADPRDHRGQRSAPAPTARKQRHATPDSLLPPCWPSPAAPPLADDETIRRPQQRWKGNPLSPSGEPGRTPDRTNLIDVSGAALTVVNAETVLSLALAVAESHWLFTESSLACSMESGVAESHWSHCHCQELLTAVHGYHWIPDKPPFVGAAAQNPTSRYVATSAGGRRRSRRSPGATSAGR
uniref:PDZ domain-containing protein n=1 Tax=Macrostomum lignano TaxID=282301 RepID=A0A1I8FKE1_9PLAT